MSPEVLKIQTPFHLDCGRILPEVEIAYHTFGTMNADKSNVVWICHAFSANSDPSDWWPGMVGEDKYFDPKDYYIVCANMLGSCYGSTGPLSIDPETGKPYFGDFPIITVRDMVRSLVHLRKHLGIEKIYFSAGFSMGGQQLLEWMIMEPDVFGNCLLGASNYRHSPWGVAFNESQRLALLADPTYGQHDPKAGADGMRAARSIALLSYRNYKAYNKTQWDEEGEKLDGYRAASYQQYQGEKLVKRFNAYSYWYLSKAMDNHNIERGRGKAEEILRTIKARTLVLGISSDYLYPIDEQLLLANFIPRCTFICIDSDYGHDGFLIEFDQLKMQLDRFLQR